MPESNTHVEFEQLCGCGLAVCATAPVLRNVPISTEETVDTAVGSLGRAKAAETLSFLASPRRANYHKGWPDLPVLPALGSCHSQTM
jgi:hypothetical protein